ncbi:MAG: tetratricopeptide repeat protein [Candidatus Acidiferrum sp.]|jgi:tetratricopeptide (TPR) repeat protein
MNTNRRFIRVTILLLAAVLLLDCCAKDPERAKAKYLALGQGYMKKGQFASAAIEFRNALRIDPRFVDAYYQLAQADLAQREWVGAYAALEKAVELDPSLLDARLDRGRLYLASREFDEAEAEAQYILRQEPNNVSASQLLGAALIGKQNNDKALAAFSRVVALRPDDPNAYVNLALVEISLRRFPEAEEHLKKAVEVDPKSMQVCIDLANFYRLQGRLTESRQVLQDGVSRNPQGIPLYIEWASALASEGRMDEARALLEKLQKLLPNSAYAAMAIGDFYMARNESGEALSEYRRALSDSPNNVDIKKRMLNLFLVSNQIKLAAPLDLELMKDAPTDVLVRVYHGRVLMAQGNTGAAIDQLQRVAADAADSPQTHYFLAMAYWQGGKTAQAGSELQAALRNSNDAPSQAMALEALTRLSLALEDYVAAQTYAGELVERFPSNPANRQLLAEALAKQQRLKEAEAQILVAKQLAPNDPVIQLNLAQIYAAEKKSPEAEKQFKLAVEADPHNSSTVTQFTDFLFARNQTSRAFLLVQHYVSSYPNEATGHALLGTLYFDSKNYGEAQAEFERSIQLDPSNIQGYLRLGKVFEATGQNQSAVAQYQKALDLQPSHAPLATMIGNFYLEKGDLETARKYYNQALSGDPNFAIAIANMAWIDAQEGKNLDTALGMAQKARSLMPESPSITDTLGWVMYKRGSYDSAIPLLKECVQKSPDSARFHYHLGMTLVAAGQKTQGKQQLEGALRLNLENSDAQQARSVLAQAD